MLKVNDVVQFNENHKWVGCLGIVSEVNPSRIMVGIPIPSNDASVIRSRTAYIFCQERDLERIGTAVLVQEDKDDDK